MEIDDITATTDYAEETRRVNRRQLMQQAITLAMQSRWQEAADVNRQIVELAPEDAEAYNRLGKAYTELGRIADAKDAYGSTLRADPANLIAQRNLDRLSLISEAEAAELTKRAGLKLDPQFFMEETGKTRVVSLKAVSGPEVLATLTAGDQAKLEQRDGNVVVTTPDGAEIGVLSQDLSTRLTRLMQTGNEYHAGVVGVDGSEVRVMIRETLQSPQNAGRLSFPPRSPPNRCLAHTFARDSCAAAPPPKRTTTTSSILTRARAMPTMTRTTRRSSDSMKERSTRHKPQSSACQIANPPLYFTFGATD